MKTALTGFSGFVSLSSAVLGTPYLAPHTVLGAYLSYEVFDFLKDTMGFYLLTSLRRCQQPLDIRYR